MYDQDLIADIAATIEHHCTEITKKDKSSAQTKAQDILRLHAHKFDAVGHNNDQKALRKLIKLLSSATEQMDGLSDETKAKLNNKLPLPQSMKKQGLAEYGEIEKLKGGKMRLKIPPFPKPASDENQRVFNGYLKKLSTIKQTTEDMLSKKPYKDKGISKKLKYDAVIVAKACKMIWRDELQLRAIAEDKPVKSPNKYVKDEYDNDPMKPFMEEMFNVMGIKEKVSSALNALERLGGEEALNVSIDIR